MTCFKPYFLLLSAMLSVAPLSGCLGSDSGAKAPGDSWKERPWLKEETPGVSLSVEGLAWDGKKMVAVGQALASDFDVPSTAFVLTSPDGLTWTRRELDAPKPFTVLHAAASSGSRYVAVGGEFVPDYEGGHLGHYKGYVLVSSDGVDWSQGYLEAAELPELHGVTWTGTLFVAVATGMILTSPDGTEWTRHMTDQAGDSITATLRTVAKIPGGLVASGWRGTLTSPDGTAWTLREVSEDGLLGFATDGNIVVGVGQVVRTSSDGGVTWVERASQTSWSAVVWTGSRFVAVGGYGASGIVGTSPDGITWTERETELSGSAMVWTGKRLVATAGYVSMTSP
jgi:hypothetical protein